MILNRFPGAKYANVFSYQLSNDLNGYHEIDEKTLSLVKDIPGYLGYENVKDKSGRSIFISYWDSLRAVNEWSKNQYHKNAKSKGKQWYSAYHSMLVKIECSSEHDSYVL